MAKWSIILVSLFFCYPLSLLSQETASPPELPLDQEVVILKNGDRITGNISGFQEATEGEEEEEEPTKKSVVVTTEFMGEISIPWEQVQGLESKRKLYFKLEDKNVVSGRVVGTTEDGRWIFNTPVLGSLEIKREEIKMVGSSKKVVEKKLLETQEQLAKKEEELRKATKVGELWSGDINISFSGNEGNDNTISFIGNVNVKRETADDIFTAGIRYKHTQNDDEVTANEAFGFLKEEVNVGERFYLFGQTSGEWNEEKGIELKFIAELGGGYYFLQPGDWEILEGDKITFKYEMAAAFSSTDLDDGDDTQTVGATAAFYYTQIFSNEWKLDITGKYFQGMNETDDYELTGEITLGIPLSETLSFTASLRDRYINLVEGDNQRNDIDWTLGLRLAF